MLCWLEEVHQVTEIDLKLPKGREGCHDAHALAVFKIGWRINGGVVWVRVLQGAPHFIVRNSEIEISFSTSKIEKEGSTRLTYILQQKKIFAIIMQYNI